MSGKKSKEIVRIRYMERYSDKHYVNLLVVQRYYNRLKRLINPVITYIEETKIKIDEQVFQDFFDSILDTYHDINTVYLFSKKKIKELKRERVGSSEEEELAIRKDLELCHDEEGSRFKHLYDAYIQAAFKLKKQELAGIVFDEVNKVFKEADCMAYIKPYNVVAKYVKFIDGLSVDEKEIMLKRITKYYSKWIYTLKKEYNLL